MVAATKYTESDILDAAAAEIASAGFDAVSVASIARALRAPSGSIYHRFRSKKHLIGALWTRTVRSYAASLTEAIHGSELDELAERIVNHTFDWVAGHPIDADLLMQFRTEDFAPADWPPDVVADVSATNDDLARRLVDVARLHGINPLDMTLAAIDVPAAAARRAILNHGDPSSSHHLRRRTTELVAHLLTTP